MQRQLEVAAAELAVSKCATTGPHALFTLEKIVHILTGGASGEASSADIAGALTLVRAILHQQIKQHKAEAGTHVLTERIECSRDRAESLHMLANAHTEHTQAQLNSDVCAAAERVRQRGEARGDGEG